MNSITYAERTSVYDAAIQKWGAEAQMIVAIEEMSELTKEVCKYFRGKVDIEAVADEIADVTIMLEQLRTIFDCNDLVCSHMDYKIERLLARVRGDTDVH